MQRRKMSCYVTRCIICVSLFLFTDASTSMIYTLSLHDALPICFDAGGDLGELIGGDDIDRHRFRRRRFERTRSEEHTSELQSRFDLVCRLLLEKKKDVPKLSPPAPTRESPPLCCTYPPLRWRYS